jgi:hypothetical protein
MEPNFISILLCCSGHATSHNHAFTEQTIPHITKQMEDLSQSDADSSESDPSSGQDFSPDYSDTDSSSGEATITAGPSGKGNLIGRALLAAGKTGHNPTKSSGGIGRGLSANEGEVAEMQHSQGGAHMESSTGYPTSSSFMPLERTLSNPAGWANEVSRHLLKSPTATSDVHQWHQPNGSAGPTRANNLNGSGLPIPNAPRTQFPSGPPIAGISPMSYPPSGIPVSGTTKQRRYPETATGAFKSVQASHSVDRPAHPVREGGSGFARSENSPETTLTMMNRSAAAEKRSPSGEATVNRTASLPRMPRLHGFSPLVQTTSLLYQEPRPTVGKALTSNETGVVDSTDSDQEGIYMDASESRRKRSVRRRRKAASDGSRTPVSPALTLSSPLLSPPIASLPSPLDSSPIQHVLGYASTRSKMRARDADQDYSARSELRKRRTSQHDQTQLLHHVLDSSYAYHIPPRLAHQPRSDFSAASTSGDSAGVSSGYTASADSGDTRSDASRSSSSVLGLSLGGDDVLGMDGRSSRRNHGSAQYPRHYMSDAGTWDGNVSNCTMRNSHVTKLTPFISGSIRTLSILHRPSFRHTRPMLYPVFKIPLGHLFLAAACRRAGDSRCTQLDVECDTSSFCYVGAHRALVGGQLDVFTLGKVLLVISNVEVY